MYKSNQAEPFNLVGSKIGFDLVDFWRWSVSDLVSNATRGRLAEFIVATALHIPLTTPRDEWAAWDLTTPEGIKVEVKSAAYIQSWNQKDLSKISFEVPKTRYWDADTNQQESVGKCQAEIYVFALLAHQDQVTIDPLNLSQWQFYVLPTLILDQRQRSQHSITLPSLEKLCKAVSYPSLRSAVLAAWGEHYQLLKPIKYRHIYICGLTAKPYQEYGLHLALQPQEGCVTKYETYNGIQITITNVRQLVIHSLPDDAPDLGHKYLTCRNWQFGFLYYGMDNFREDLYKKFNVSKS